jgi:hypothetical protein
VGLFTWHLALKVAPSARNLNAIRDCRFIDGIGVGSR